MKSFIDNLAVILVETNLIVGALRNGSPFARVALNCASANFINYTCCCQGSGKTPPVLNSCRPALGGATGCGRLVWNQIDFVCATCLLNERCGGGRRVNQVNLTFFDRTANECLC